MNDYSLPHDIKQCMRECILNIFWARKDIFSFFQNNGVPKTVLRNIERFDEEQINRAKMVEIVFDTLSARPDGGLGPFRSMLKALTEWSHFDAYYFDKLRKLDRNQAQSKLNHLRQLVEIRDAKIREDRKRQEHAKKTSQDASLSQKRSDLLARFLNAFQNSMNPQRRGYEFERIITNIASMEGLQVTTPFKSNGEQIDGGLKFDGENYIIEAKWHDKSASTEPLYAFAKKVEGKMYGRGIFISVNGFNPEPVTGLITGKALNTILVDGEDLTLSLEGVTTFSEMLSRKISAAQLKGQIYIHSVKQKSKHI